MIRLPAAFAIAALAGLVLGVAVAPAPRRPAATILREHDARRLPSGFLDDEQVQELERACRERCRLDLELQGAWPDHARAPELAEERWALLENTFGEHETVLAETRRVLASSPPRALARKASFARAWSALHCARIGTGDALGFAQEARAAGTGDERFATLLLFAAQEKTADPALQRKLCERIESELPRAAVAGADARRWAELIARVGAPFELDFTDVETGKPASLASWSGRPLLVRVRRASDWKPMSEETLEEIETKWSPRNLAVIDLVIGNPESPARRAGRRFVVSESDPTFSLETRLGIRKTPTFLLVDDRGRLAAVSERIEATLERLGASPAEAAPPAR